MRRILPVVGLILLFGLACADESEAPVPSDSATATPSGELSSPGATAPDDWVTYVNPDGKFSLKYPADWFAKSDDDFISVDPTEPDGDGPRPEVIEVEANHSPSKGSNACGGAQEVDPNTGESLGPREGSVPVTIDGLQGWRIIRLAGDPAIQGPFTRIDGVSVVYEGNCFHIAAYYTQEQPDELIFNQMLSSVELFDRP